MAADTVVPADASSAEVMASVESTDRAPMLVIADISRDDAWLSVPVSEAPTLDDWR